MRLKLSNKKNNEACGEGKYCVQLYSRCASLVNEFCLDKRENNIADMEAAERLLRQAVAPCDFASATLTLIGGEGTSDESVLQFSPERD